MYTSYTNNTHNHNTITPDMYTSYNAGGRQRKITWRVMFSSRCDVSEWMTKV
jgi:hypothetical protein